jgi:hypothetical protein
MSTWIPLGFIGLLGLYMVYLFLAERRESHALASAEAVAMPFAGAAAAHAPSHHGHGDSGHHHDAPAHGHDAHGHDAHGHDAHGHDAHGHEAHGHDAHGHDPHGHDAHGHDAHADDHHAPAAAAPAPVAQASAPAFRKKRNLVWQTAWVWLPLFSGAGAEAYFGRYKPVVDPLIDQAIQSVRHLM